MHNIRKREVPLLVERREREREGDREGGERAKGFLDHCFVLVTKERYVYNGAKAGRRERVDRVNGQEEDGLAGFLLVNFELSGLSFFRHCGV